MRRTFLSWMGVLAVLTLVPWSPALAATAGPIRVGFMSSLSGLFAPAGLDMEAGFRLAWEQAGFRAAGRKVDLIVEDDEASNAAAVAKYRKLVFQDRVHVFAGVFLTNVGYGLMPMIERDQVPTLFLTTPDDLTKRRPSKWALRANYSASQTMHPLGDYASRVLGYRKVAALGLDNGFGYEQLGGFQRVFEGLGGKVVQKLWIPLNAQDLAPYITQLRRDADAVLVVLPSAQAIQFVRGYREYGLKGKIPLIASGVVTDESVLRAMGDDALGIVSALNWSATLPNRVNQAFVQAATAQFGKTPGYYSAVMYSAARWIAEAARIVNGDVEDKARFVEALRKASETVEDPRGPIALDALGNPTQNVYILKVERAGDRLQNSVIHTYPAVSQFWTYTPEEFLKEPAYGRDYPPAKP